MGGKIWVDKRVLLRHTGTYTFDFAAQEPLYKALHDMAITNGTVPASTVAAAQPVTSTPATQLAPNITPKVLSSNEKKPAKKKSKAA